MNLLSAAQMANLRQKLEKAKEELQQRLQGEEQHGLADSSGGQTGELSAYDNHPADLGTETFERAKDIALQENAELRLKSIDSALERMANGRYGTCAVCGKPIPYERLSAVPETPYCVDHTPEPNVPIQRPVEEQRLSPPYGRRGAHNPNENNGFDGEDAWQIVESWGNSDSPAMAEDPEIADYNHLYEEADEQDGYVEPLESFLAVDLYGNEVRVIRNKAYREYMENREGVPLLEPDEYPENT